MQQKQRGWADRLGTFFSLKGKWKVFRKTEENGESSDGIELSHVLEPVGPLQEGADVLDVIVVHGLGGDPIGTWKSPTTGEFWPIWLAADLGRVQVWTLKWPSHGYSFAPSSGLSIVDVAHATLELLDSHNLGGRPIVFICHSMGGILFKQLFHSAATLKNSTWERLLRHTVGVVFMGTPHTGSSLANLLQHVPKVPSMRTHELQRNDSSLRLINTWYRVNAPTLQIATLTFFETRKVGPTLVVDQSSADSNVPDSIPIAVDADHFTICKPASRKENSYLAIKRFIERLRPTSMPTVPGTIASGLNELFRASYLHSNDHRVVFGGRRQQIAQLNAWLGAEEGPRRMLITGPTGRGKSALLVRWLAQLDIHPETAQWHAVFVPISIRFGTSRPAVYYKLLAQELASLLGRTLNAPSSDPEEFYLAEGAALLKAVNESGIKVVVVVDGLDETVGEAFNASIFPGLLQENLKLLLSARQVAGDIGVEGWKARLGWMGNNTNDAVLLPGLDRDGVHETLISAELDPAILPETLPDRLLELSQGEPLLVQLYVEDIAELATRNENFNLEQLSSIEPGYGPYMLRWLEQQEQIWKEAEEPVNRRSIDAALAVLSAAFGPLQAEDFIHLVSDLLGEAAPLAAAAYIAPIRRFIIGRGTKQGGYVLSHPKLGQYLSEEYFSTVKMKSVHESFARWGDAVLQERDTTGAANVVTPYLLQHYVNHIQIAGISLQRCSALLSEFWARAWENFEGGFKGYSSDIRKVLEGVGRARDWGNASAQAAAVKLRACLILSSIRSIGTNIPSELLQLGLKHELLTWRHAAHYIELQVPENQPQFFAETFAFIPEDERQTALNRILRTENVGNRIQFITKILGACSLEERERLTDIAVSLLSEDDVPLHRFAQTVELVPWHPVLLDNLIVDDPTLGIAEEHLMSYAHQYARLATAIETAGRSGAWAFACSVQLIDRIANPVDQLLTVWNVAEVCGLPAVQVLVARVVNAARPYIEHLVAIQQGRGGSIIERFRATNAFSALAKLTLLAASDLDDAAYAHELEQVLNLLRGIEDWEQAREVTNLLPLVRHAHFATAFDRACALADGLRTGNNRTHAFLRLAKSAPPDRQMELVRKAMANARLIEDQVTQTRARIALYSQLPPEERQADRAEILVEIGQISYVVHRAELFMALAAHEDEALQAQLREASYQLLHMAFDTYTRLNETINLFANAPTALRQRAFADCMALIRNESLDGVRGFALGRLADAFGDLWSCVDLDEVLRLLPTGSEEYSRAIPSLMPIAIRFGASHLIAETQALALCAADPSVRRSALSTLAAHVSDARTYIQQLDRAWEHAASLEEESQQASAWIELLPLYQSVDSEKHRVTLDLVLQIPGNWSLLQRLALQATSDAEREELLLRALTSAAQERPDTAVTAAAQIVKSTMRRDTRSDAFDLITSQTGISRSTFLHTLQHFPAVILELGGVELVRQVSRDITEVNNIWT